MQTLVQTRLWWARGGSVALTASHTFNFNAHILARSHVFSKKRYTCLCGVFRVREKSGEVATRKPDSSL